MRLRFRAGTAFLRLAASRRGWSLVSYCLTSPTAVASATGYDRAVPIRSAWVRPAPVCFVLGLLGVLPMVVLTPPFQVPDEQEHFHRAYQLSELRMLGIVRDGAAGGMLPSSLIELSEDFWARGLSIAPIEGLPRNRCGTLCWRWIGR